MIPVGRFGPEHMSQPAPFRFVIGMKRANVHRMASSFPHSSAFIMPRNFTWNNPDLLHRGTWQGMSSEAWTLIQESKTTTRGDDTKECRYEEAGPES